MRAEVVDMSEDVVSFAEEFIGYIRSTYMNGAFGNEDDGWEWNAFERVEDGFLTNNPSEGANNRLRKRARTDHPGFYRFCDLMKEESENVKNKCQQFEQGLLMPPKPTSRASKVKQSRIQLKQMLERGQTSLRKYLRTLGRMNHVQKGNRRHRGRVLGADSLLRGIVEHFATFQFSILINPGALESVTKLSSLCVVGADVADVVGAWAEQVVQEEEEQLPLTGLKHFFV